MGFDIECIVDIHTYPGEYFCPVCRTLVYPNEALQSQCTHLYCKPCLVHVASSTRACPYDGYLVTEADSKPLLEADKALAENVGKVKVRCLFHRSGCTWEGALSESSLHCSACTFGNSAVICNRCGVQIVHRQVHDHAQSCPGVYQAQQAAGQDAATSGVAAVAAAAISTGDQKQEVVQSAASTTQIQNPQTTAARPIGAQDHNQQATTNTQAPAAAPAATPTPEQWYQQYYQQYAGYDPYNQVYQQYYPYQQQSGQQYQQVQGQYYPQVYSQPQPQVPVQLQTQPQVQPQIQVQSQPLPQSQPPQPKVQAQSQAPSLVPVQGQSQPQSHVPIAPQYQNPAKPNQQPQIPPQFQPNGQGNPTPQMQTYALPPHPMQSQPQQYVHMPQYQQPHIQMNTPHVSLNNVQPIIHGQTQPPSQPQTQAHPQPHLQNHPPSYPQTNPPKLNQPTVPNAQPQSSHQAGPAVSGHQSYQPPQQMQMGAPQQHPVHPHSMTGSLPMHGQIPQQLRPPLSHVPFPSQQQSSIPSHGQVPSLPPAHQQQFYPHAPPPGPTVQQHPGIQPVQQSMPQQLQSFPGPSQGPYDHFGQHQSMQSQLRPQGAPRVLQPVSQVYTPSKQNVALAPGVQPQQPQNYLVRPLMPTQGMQPQSFLQSSSLFGAVAHNKPAQLAPNQPFGDQNYANRTITPEISDAAAPVQGGTQMLKSGEKVDIGDGTELKPAKSETSMKHEHEAPEKSGPRSELIETLVKDVDRETPKDGSGEPVIQQTVKEEPAEGSTDPPPTENPFGSSAVEDKDTTFDSKESHQNDTSTGIPEDNQVALSASGTDGSDGFMGKNQSQQLRNDPSSQNFGHPSHPLNFADPLMSQAKLPPGPPPRPQSSLRPQGPEYMHPGQPFNPVDFSQPPLLNQPPDAPFGGFPRPGSASSFGPPRSFEQHPAAPQRPPFPGVPPGSVDPRSGIMGRVPQHYPEGQLGGQDSVNPVENNILHNQRLNKFDGGAFGQPSGVEPRSRMHGRAGTGSPAFRLHEESIVPRPREHADPFAMEQIRPFDQAMASGPPSRFMPPPHHAAGFHPDAPAGRELPPAVPEEYRGKVDPARAHQDFLKPDPVFGRHHIDHRAPMSPGREYFGMPPRGPHSFGEGSGPFNFPPDGVGNSFSGRMQRFEPDGPDNMRFGERVTTVSRRSDMLGPRNFSGHFRWGEPAGFGAFPRRGRMEELGGGFPHHFAGGESFRGDHTNVPFHSKPGFKSSYSRFPNDGLYAGDLDAFGKTRKRKPVSLGWCRICKIDCETVEGLDVHSQSREHQRMAMDMVKSIKLQNKKKSKLSGDHTGGVEEANKARNTGFEGRGNKPRVS